ncbi:UDP-2,4-diacetamido-2,4,6-trideoxy-beta-L-altropyranose hydrolase [Balneolaceae bacterium YR4-1]|uniref:UDP-2,4-diacetamido-2,4, 6-trideoxy-beta-L-altropyranose hydrolase n=1 Tax=Halalkalibaculum roseum TaxID=2709311 RepID=A0A6M1T5V0_9BACT|nr:UDP-2,4-diacetamido-2,4,6-trideoxy-beta-L-altropyranose hydrolase [Halalkalibaculum roseum]NGP78147.1 UDP-2,4-diacetamido-2,4,6-trideoxy-beta-L-altropyranose hydrolase [Halalkalibaculum roseum]
MKGQVKIRTDGSSSIGLGHIVRCISLAHMIKDEFDIHFYSLSLPDSLQREIKEEGWTVTLINQESDFMASLNGDEIVVLDGYQFDSGYQKKIKDKGAKLVCIDDFHDQYFYADLVINHAPGITENEYDGEPYTKYLLGPDYALLRPEFLKSSNHNKRNFKNVIKNIFICFGGSDPKNLTSKILEWLPQNEFNVTVILGNRYQHHDDLKNIIRQRKNLVVSVKTSLSAKEIRQEMINADFGIVPASGILFEIISVNTPAISGMYMANQFLIYRGFKKKDVFIDVCNFDRNKIASSINRLNGIKLEQIRENQKQVIDNRSHIRLASEFRKF